MSIALIHENPNRKTAQIYDTELSIFVLASEDGKPDQRLSMCEQAVNIAHVKFKRIYGMERTKELAKKGLSEAVKAANKHNYDLIKKAKQKSVNLNHVNMDIGIILEHDVYFVHVGSDGIYHYRDNTLKKLSEDHTIGGSNDNSLTQGIGMEQTIEEQRTKITLKHNDYLFICNSSFCQTMGEDRIRRSLYKTFEPVDEIARNMKNEAISRGCDSICGLLYKHDRR